MKAPAVLDGVVLHCGRVDELLQVDRVVRVPKDGWGDGLLRRRCARLDANRERYDRVVAEAL
eukprot:6727479-Pyramimonas_sp.AAC.1